MFVAPATLLDCATVEIAAVVHQLERRTAVAAEVTIAPLHEPDQSAVQIAAFGGQPVLMAPTWSG